MRKKILMILAGFGIGMTLLLPAGTASAALFDAAKDDACKGAALDNSASGDCGDTAAEDTSSLIQSIVNLLTIIVGIIAVIMIIIYGLKFVTSGGDSNSISSARNGVIYAIVGLIVVALAQIIVRFVINRTTS